MNKDDSERLARELLRAGHVPVSHPDRASVIILNGCAVRDNSDRKVWGRVGALKSEKRKRPDLLVALTGCTANAPESEKAPYRDTLDIVFDSRQSDSLLDLLDRRPGPVTDDWEAYGPEEIPGTGKVSRYVTIIHGCNRRCTFCIVPFRRGPEQSRQPGEILDEARMKVAEGAREITLLGQIVNKYGSDLEGGENLASLLRFLDTGNAAQRLRFLTAHPRNFGEDIADAMAELPSVCEEINLPIQAGDDLVLKRMGRGYTVDFYRARIDMIRARVPGVAISTDIIVGFPGETAEQFERTIDILSEIRFDVTHVAAFSARVGTVAGGWPDDVSPEEKMERLHAVENVQEEIAREINSCLIGKTEEVLFDELKSSPVPGGEPRWAGRTRSNKLVFCEHASDVSVGDIRDVEILNATAWSLRGKVAAPVLA